MTLRNVQDFLHTASNTVFKASMQSANMSRILFETESHMRRIMLKGITTLSTTEQAKYHCYRKPATLCYDDGVCLLRGRNVPL
jgi:hypothetical protein